MTDITRMTTDEAVTLLRGKEATTVRIGFLRGNDDRPQIVSFRRAKIVAIETKVESRIEPVASRKVGYLDVPNFYYDADTNQSTANEVRKRLQGFAAQSVDVVVMDLRRCGGGYLDQAIELAGLFVDRGPIAQTKTASSEIRSLDNTATSIAWHGPLVVLTGRQTGSGAEIVAAAIQDYRRGLIVGDDSTAGMGLIANVVTVANDLGYVMVTTEQFFRVSGEAIHQVGLKPDVVIPSVGMLASRQAAAPVSLGFDRQKPMGFQSHDMVNQETVLSLRAHSRERRRTSGLFKKLQTLIEWNEGHMTRAVETLNETEYRSKLNEAPANDLPRAKLGETDYHLQEVFKVATDYAASVGTARATARTPAPSGNTGVVAPRVDPAEQQNRERANAIESTRQAIEELEETTRVANNQMLAAKATMVLAEKAWQRTESGSFGELLAEAAYLAAERALAEIVADLRRAESELAAQRDRYNRLRR